MVFWSLDQRWLGATNGKNENRIQFPESQLSTSAAIALSLFVFFFFQQYGHHNVTWERSTAHVIGGHVDLTSQKEIFSWIFFLCRYTTVTAISLFRLMCRTTSRMLPMSLRLVWTWHSNRLTIYLLPWKLSPVNCSVCLWRCSLPPSKTLNFFIAGLIFSFSQSPSVKSNVMTPWIFAIFDTVEPSPFIVFGRKFCSLCKSDTERFAVVKI